jgi:hypothetical protein
LNAIFAEKSTLHDAGIATPNFPPNLDTPILGQINIKCKEVKRALMELDVNKAVGPDGIGPMVLKKCAPELAPSLARLFRLSIRSGRTPSEWRTAHISPIHKGGSKSDPNNYRPVSLLPIVSKVLETIINKRLKKHLLQHNLLSPHQFGFLPGRSTLDLIASLTQSWSSAVDSGSEVRVVALDISRAFDRVWHRGLLTKLHGFSVGGRVFDWIKGFLTGRRQAVLLNGQRSSYRHTNAGVPQGSVLGPTLFLIFINDIFSQVESCLDLFADDSSLHHVISSRAERYSVANTINRDLKKLADWASSWLITFNAKKTKVLTISNARDAAVGHPQLVFQGHRLPEEANITLVGVTINQHLTWGDHIKTIAARAGQRLGALLRCSHYLPPPALLAAYKNFVRSSMEYCSPVWAGGPSTDLALLSRIQRRALWACGVDPDNGRLCGQLSVQSLAHRRTVSSLCLLHRMVTGKAPEPLSRLCPPLFVAPRATRSALHAHPHRLTVHRSRTSRQASSFLHRTVRRWNSLPPAVLAGHPQSLEHFKARVNKVDLCQF